MENSILTKDGIELLNKAIAEKKLDNLNIILQVSGCRPQESVNKKMIRCIVNDINFKCGAVIIPSEKQDIEENDLVKIEQIYGQGNSQSSNKINSLIVIKRCQIVKKNSPIIHDIDNLSNFTSRINTNKTDDNTNPNTNNTHSNFKNNYNNNYNNTNNNNSSHFNRNQNPEFQNIHSAEFDEKRYMKINSLSSFTKEICIKARVTKKYEKKNFNKQNGQQGSLFSFNLIDDNGDELPVSAFNHVCEKFYDKIEENMVYELTGGYVKINDKKYTAIKSEYKLFLDDKTEIRLLQDDGKIHKVNFKFVKVGDLPSIEQYTSVDIRAMVVEIAEKNIIKTKKNEEREVRKIQIGDSTGYKVEVTIWGKKSDFNFDLNTVYGFKALKVNDYKGKTLNMGDESQIVELDDKDAMNEKMECGSFDGNFKVLPIERIEENSGQMYPIKSIKEITDLLDTTDDEKFKFPLCKVKANIVSISLNERSYYTGCPDCKKKIAENDTECQFCRKTFEKPAFYYSLNLKLKDHSGDFYADVLGAVGQKVIGMSCEDFKDIMNSGEEDKQKSIARKVESQSSWFVISPKINLYNDIKRKRYSIIKVIEIDSQKTAEYIIEAFMKMPQFN
jgi:replication factor A1